MKHPELFSSDALPIDVFISPEQLLTNYIKRLIEFPGALQVLDFADDKVQLIAVKPYYSGPLVGQTLAKLSEHIPNVAMHVAAIYRGNQSIPLSTDTTIEVGDEVFFIAAEKDIRTVLSAFKRLENPYKYITIAGGGNIGQSLAAALENDYQVKIIDHNSSRTENLAQKLEHTTVLQGDACDRSLLIDENIEHTDVFCAVTNDDEVNIMACLQAKQLGAKHVMALTTRTAYVDLIEGGDIDIAISPQQATIGSILTKLRHGDIVNVHALRRGAAEAIEIIIHGDKKTSKIVGRTLKEIKLPRGTSFGAIVQGDEVIINNLDTIAKDGDHLILFLTDKHKLKDIERLFQVSATFF